MGGVNIFSSGRVTHHSTLMLVKCVMLGTEIGQNP
jgi:hypothetical protein